MYFKAVVLYSNKDICIITIILNNWLCICRLFEMDVDNYKRLLCTRYENQYFVLDWGGLVLRNYSDNGSLVHFDNLKSYKQQEQYMWVKLDLYLFYDEAATRFFPVYVCENCTMMNSIREGFSKEAGKLGFQI